MSAPEASPKRRSNSKRGVALIALAAGAGVLARLRAGVGGERSKPAPAPRWLRSRRSRL